MVDKHPSRFLRIVQRINKDDIRHQECIQDMIDKAAADSPPAP